MSTATLTLPQRLANAYPRLKPETVARNTAFGVIMNTPNPDGETLQSKLGVNQAKDVVSETLTLLGYPQFEQTVVDF